MASEDPIVSVKQGQLRGVHEKSVYGDQFVAFRGIPYAKPPIGHLRFKDPEPPETWTGIRDAKNFGDISAQIDMMLNELLGSDDCLYLNVYAPSIEPSSKRAVMVWIHGGAFICGSGNSFFYAPDYLIRKDIVLVTINYRLGVLGFLNFEHEVATGNQGLKDQVMALKWIQENISSFGGDPNNVTIFGESAGAASVHYLTICPMSQGLFHKAISQSGVATNPWAFITREPGKYAFQLAARLGKETTDPEVAIEFLRTVEPLKLVAAGDEIVTPEEKHIIFGIFGPTIDDMSPNPFMPQHPSQLMKAGVKVPYMLGYCSVEGSIVLSPFKGQKSIETLERINANFDQVVYPETKAILKKEGISINDVRRIYFGDRPICHETKQEYANYMSDMMFLQGIYDVLKVQIEKNASPTYLYKFTYDSPDSFVKLKMDIDLPGTTHADDLFYIFYSDFMKQLNLEPPKPGSKKYKIIEYFTQMWTDFAKTGNPTPKTTELISTIWEPVKQGDVYNYLDIGETLKMDTTTKEEHTFEWKRIKNKL